MEQFDIIITNGTILTMDGENRVVENGTICIKGDTIARIIPPEEMDARGVLQAKKTIDAQGGLVLPGLVNGHTHAAMSLFRGLG